LAYRYERKFALWWVLLGVLVLLGSLSVRPVMRLQSVPPAGFAEVRPEWGAKRKISEERLAHAYWECAVGVVQWKYAYGTGLPEKPPPEFTLTGASLPPETLVPADARLRYWRRLGKVWSDPKVWRKTYTWSPNLSFAALKAFLERLFGPGRGEAVSPR
jgi:hypothetical protein